MIDVVLDDPARDRFFDFRARAGHSKEARIAAEGGALHSLSGAGTGDLSG